jgi:O-methyltransferase involved in polyketide biosynthesis
MYLSLHALDSSVALIHAVSGPGSILALDFIPPQPYISDAQQPAPVHAVRAVLGRRAAAWAACALHALTLNFWSHLWLVLWLRVAGEPLRFNGWREEELPAWLAARGWRLLSDRSDADMAAEYGVPGATVAALRTRRFAPFTERFVAAARVSDAE